MKHVTSQMMFALVCLVEEVILLCSLYFSQTGNVKHIKKWIHLELDNQVKREFCAFKPESYTVKGIVILQWKTGAWVGKEDEMVLSLQNATFKI